jgi:hypothetical protein
MEPVEVERSVTKVQLEAAMRQILIAVGAVAGVLGHKDAVGTISASMEIVGPLAAVIAFVWGQVATRSQASKLTAVTANVSDAIAKFK